VQDFANGVGAPPALWAPGGAGARQYRVIIPSPTPPPPAARRGGSALSRAEKEARVRGAWGDFAILCPGEVVGGVPLQPALVPRHWGVRATGRGRQCSLRLRVTRGAPGGKTKARGLLDEGSGAPFSICAWEVYLKCAVPGAASGAARSLPHPSLPGLGLATLGRVGAPARSSSAVGRSPPVSGKSSGELGRLLVRRERSCAWGRGMLGWQASGLMERLRSRGLCSDGRVSSGFVPQGGLRVTCGGGVSIWGRRIPESKDTELK
jgi:hypothetical protein